MPSPTSCLNLPSSIVGTWDFSEYTKKLNWADGWVEFSDDDRAKRRRHRENVQKMKKEKRKWRRNLQLNRVWKENQFKLRTAEENEICIKIQFSWQNNLLWQTTYLLTLTDCLRSSSVFLSSNWFSMELKCWRKTRGEQRHARGEMRYWILQTL